MLHKKRASVFQQGRELFRPCIFSIIQHYWDRIAGPLDAHLTACPLYYAGDVVSPRQIITWPSWSLQPSCIQWCAPWSKPVPHNCVLFPVTSPEGVRGGKKIKPLVFLASPPQQSNREATGRPGEEAAATGFCASTEHRLAAEPGPEIRSEPARLQGKGRGGKGSTFSEQEEGEAMSVSCCAAETSKDVITFTLPQGVSRLRAKVQSFPMHYEEGGFGGETSSGFIANSALCTRIAKQRSSVLPGSAAKYCMWLETIFAQEPCCSCFSCTACVRILLQYRNALSSPYSPCFCKHLEIKPYIFLDPTE